MVFSLAIILALSLIPILEELYQRAFPQLILLLLLLLLQLLLLLRLVAILTVCLLIYLLLLLVQVLHHQSSKLKWLVALRLMRLFLSTHTAFTWRSWQRCLSIRSCRTTWLNHHLRLILLLL